MELGALCRDGRKIGSVCERAPADVSHARPRPLSSYFTNLAISALPSFDFILALSE
jgi:hypothetical protein